MKALEEQPIWKKIRWVLLFLVSALVFFQLILLRPSTLEEPEAPEISKTKRELMSLLVPESSQLWDRIPEGIIPGYALEGFETTMTDKGIKQWLIVAAKGRAFSEQKLMHASIVKAELYDSNDEITYVNSDEALYELNKKDLELAGDVFTKMPDGFFIRTQRMKYLPEENVILVPEGTPVYGESQEDDSKRLVFTANGMRFERNTNRIWLTGGVQALLYRTAKSTDPNQSAVSDQTLVISDQANVLRDRSEIDFYMHSWRKAHERFVQIWQPDLYARSRTAKMRYSQFGEGLQYMIAKTDVMTQELETPESSPNPSLRYTTSGIAEFNSKRNTIVLKELPQVYEDQDTVTGDVIVIHRDTDKVEISYGNAFSYDALNSDEGKSQPAAPLGPVAPFPYMPSPTPAPRWWDWLGN